jgi:gliding motility-associated lipoprotein GldH
MFLMLCCLGLCGCRHEQKNAELLHRSFYNCIWERFDYVRNKIEVKEETTFDLSMKISFTEEYPYKDFSMVFTVFTENDEPYRSKGYKFNLKDAEDHWNSELVDGCYTFELPINKNLMITEPGIYCFQIENKMPITPLVGVKELTLINN